MSQQEKEGDVNYKALQKLHDHDAWLLKPFVGQYRHVTVSCYKVNMNLKRGRKFLLEKFGGIQRDLKLKKQVSWTLTATPLS